MNKKLYTLLALIFSLCFAVTFSACGDDDDDDSATQKWKTYNETLVDKVRQKSNEVLETGYEYRKIASYSGNGNIYWKSSDNIKSGIATKITPEGTPQFADSVVCRYTGWYLDYDGNKVVFQSTEGDYNKQTGVGFRLNAVIDGWATMLQYMRAGEEVEVCIPYALGYGSSGRSSSDNISLSIPAYTTLWFNMKLLKIIPVNPGEFD